MDEMERKEVGARKLIELLRSRPEEIIKIASLAYALGLEGKSLIEAVPVKTA